MRLPRDRDELIAQGKVPHRARVFLDGKFVSVVHEVDDDEGWVKTIVYNEAGKHNQVQRGRIEIRFPGEEGYNAAPS